MAIGIWMIGARGSLATTVATGLAALGIHAVGPEGMVSMLDDFADADLPDVHDLVVGGHDISQVSLRKRAEELADARVFPGALLRLVGSALDDADARIRMGIAAGDLPREAIVRVQEDIRSFKEDHGLDRVIVVNVSSTEGDVPGSPAHATLAALDAALDAGDDVVPASSLYAYAAIDAGHPFVDFTPSMGASIPALEELARARGVVHAGRDGKTGETLVKTALAPMFLSRNLRVRSWAGTNLLGGGDGASLAEPERAAAKLRSKGESLDAILGYETTHPVHIDYVEDLGQWKTAWNHISFEGFLGTGMKMQFVWEGCDSALAAPLIIDLVRFVDAAQRSGRVGVQSELGFFFKDPAGSHEHRLAQQFDALVAWANGLGAAS
jgi:myo-inositol-1-phosphate synthase